MEARDKKKTSRKKYVAIFLLVLVVGIGGFAFLAREWQRSIVGVRVVITGAHITDSLQIATMIDLPDTARLADLDLLAIKRKILTHPYIRDVVLRRDPPGTLQVDIRERVPAAVLIDAGNRNWLIDTAGVILPVAASIPIHDAPILSGTGNIGGMKPGVRVSAANVQRGLSILRRMEVVDRSILDLISEINVGDTSNVTVYMLEGGVAVRFGSEDRIDAKLKILKAFWTSPAGQYEPALLEYIDLRFRNQVIVRGRERQGAGDPELDPVEKEIMKPSLD